MLLFVYCSLCVNVIEDIDNLLNDANDVITELDDTLWPNVLYNGAMCWPDVKDSNVLVLGGSVTAGHGVGGKKNSWPSFLPYNVVNRAVGGTGSNYAVANFKTLTKGSDWNIIMLEYAVNDDDVGVKIRYANELSVTLAFETLVRLIRVNFPEAMIIVVELFRPIKKFHGFISGQVCHDVISKYYELAVISVRDMIWHDYNDGKYLSLIHI